MALAVVAAVQVMLEQEMNLGEREQFTLTAVMVAIRHLILAVVVVVELLSLAQMQLALMAAMAVMAQVLILLGVLQLQLVKM
jgi:hypothetical protein